MRLATPGIQSGHLGHRIFQMLVGLGPSLRWDDEVFMVDVVVRRIASIVQPA